MHLFVIDFKIAFKNQDSDFPVFEAFVFAVWLKNVIFNEWK